MPDSTFNSAMINIGGYIVCRFFYMIVGIAHITFKQDYYSMKTGKSDKKLCLNKGLAVVYFTECDIMELLKSCQIVVKNG